MEPDKVIQPFVEGTIKMLELMAGVDARQGKVKPGDFTGSICGVIKLDGEAWGDVSIFLAEETARKLVTALLGTDPGSTDTSTVLDGTGEMVNMISGYAKAALADTPYYFIMSLPEVYRIEGELSEARLSETTVVETELGSIAILLQVETEASTFQAEQRGWDEIDG